MFPRSNARVKMENRPFGEGIFLPPGVTVTVHRPDHWSTVWWVELHRNGVLLLAERFKTYRDADAYRSRVINEILAYDIHGVSPAKPDLF